MISAASTLLRVDDIAKLFSWLLEKLSFSFSDGYLGAKLSGCTFVDNELLIKSFNSDRETKVTDKAGKSCLDEAFVNKYSFLLVVVVVVSLR